MELRCVACNGTGCNKCQGGTISITACPIEIVPVTTWEIVRYADWFEKGLPPVAGGALDQAHNFLVAAGFVWNERRYWKNKLGIM